MPGNTVGEPFIHDLHRALNYLYDPVALRNSPLVARFGVEQRDDPASALRQILLDAIESLKPDEDVPIQSSAWRYYQILFNRYAEQFIQQEVATDLGLSIRQLRRQEKLAIQALANYLWSHYNLETKQQWTESSPAPGTGEKAAVDIVPSRRQELEWTQRSLPSKSTTVEEMIRAATKVATPLCQAYGVHIESTVPANLPRLAVQLVAVQQALLSVLTTAIRGMPGGTVRVEARAHPREVCIQVTCRSHTLGKDSEGLKMAGELVEFSGGRLEVSTRQNQDQPTTVRLILPVRTPIRVLAIDDNPDTLQLWQRYASGTDYDLIGVRDPGQALSLATEVYPHIVVLDIMLPGIDGWELLGRLREHPKLRGVPIIVCTILPQEQLALALGAVSFLRKPVSRHTFLAALDAQTNPLH